MSTLCDRINADPRIAELTQRHLERMRAAIGAGVDRAARMGESVVLPAATLSTVLFAAVIGVLARATSDRTDALAMLLSTRDLLPTPPPA